MNPQPASMRSILHSVQLSKGRVEALTDGIFAIAMTLLVLELKLPELPKSVSNQEILHHLREMAPGFFSFLVSFLYCGVLWVLHHMAMHFVRHVRTALVWLNLLFLMTISVLPFSCALLGHYLHNLVAQEIYFLNLFAAAVLLWRQWVVARKRGMINEDDTRAVRAMGIQLTGLPVAIAAALLVTFYAPMAGFYAMASVLFAFRIWQRKAMRREIIVPANPSA